MMEMRQGLTALLATGSEVSRSWWVTFLAAAHLKAGYAEEGLRVLDEAWAVAQTTGTHIYESERYRLKGELLLIQSSDNPTEAETCFYQALDVSRHQQAKSLELRAATGMARLWQQQGKRQDAYDLLAPLYAWFTEDFDTADLKEANALLQELEG